ncbi:MAG: transcriptional regulator with XRE-family HTH domain, partial [Spirosomataceae bacterium]
MNLSPDIIKLVFGLKVNQYRHGKNLSFAELSKKSGLSASYLNEIEKGKKYPKTDKIMQLADALEVTYDELVSLKLGNQLGSVSDLITSNFLSEVPFDFFGIDPKSLLEMLVNAPAKVSAFIRTVVGIGRNYNLSVEQFYFAVLRSYQELHQNAFPDLEKAAENFFDEYRIDESVTLDEFFLTNLLADKFGISIDFYSDKEHPNLSSIRSIFQREKNTLMLNSKTSSRQRAFTILREIGFL